MNDHRKGIGIAVFGVLTVTPDAVLLRWAEASGAKLVSIVFWKCFFMSVLVFTYSQIVKRGMSLKWPCLTLALGLAQAASIICLSYGFVLTYAAQAVMLYSLHPLHSAVLGYIFLHDFLPIETKLALILALAAMVVMFWPDLLSGNFGGTRQAVGDALSFSASVTVAIFLTLTRKASKIAPEVSAPLASSFGLLLASALVAAGAFYTRSSILDGMSPMGFVACGLDALAVSTVNVAFAIAPKYVSATQVGLISLIEACLGPVWVFLIYHEMPPVYTIIGGILLLAVLASHELCKGSNFRRKKYIATENDESPGDIVSSLQDPLLPDTATSTSMQEE